MNTRGMLDPSKYPSPEFHFDYPPLVSPGLGDAASMVQDLMSDEETCHDRVHQSLSAKSPKKGMSLARSHPRIAFRSPMKRSKERTIASPEQRALFVQRRRRNLLQRGASLG